MKKLALVLLVFGFASFYSFAQDINLDQKANLLFSKSNSQLTSAEKIEIFRLSGFELAANGTQFYHSANPEEANTPFDVIVHPIDINNDGIEEIGIIYGQLNTKKVMDRSTLLFVRDRSGQFTANLGLPGALIFININDRVFSDVIISGPGYEFPVYRWNGYAYLKHKTITKNKLGKLNLTYLSQASYAYSRTLVRE